MLGQWLGQSFGVFPPRRQDNQRQISPPQGHLQTCCVSSCISSSRETRVSRGSSQTETGTMRFKALLLPTLLGWTMIAIGLGAMATVMWMTGRFGWSLQEVTADRWASACLHLLNDAAGASLVAASGVMLNLEGWRTRLMGLIALPCALVLVAYSIASVYGFMSTRITQLESHKNIVAWQRGELDWKRKTSISREVAKSDRQLLRAEAHHAAKQLKDPCNSSQMARRPASLLGSTRALSAFSAPWSSPPPVLVSSSRWPVSFSGFFSCHIARSTWQQEPKVRLVRRALAMAPLGQLGDNSFILSHSN